MIKAIIFDFAGVIGSDGYWVWLKDVVPDLENKKELFASLADKVDKGLITNKESINSLSKATGIPRDEVWPQVFKRIQINNKLLTYIERLKKSYKIGLLSNFNYVWLEDLLEKYDLARHFDSVCISSRHNVLKPESAAFHKMLEMLDVKPHEAIFVDDRQVHFDAANKLGIKSFLYTTNEQLTRDFKDFGIHVI